MAEAKIVLFRCSTTRELFGVRVQKTLRGDWERTWAFKMSEKVAKNEGYDREVVSGSMEKTADFPGCPYCGNYGFFQCGNCDKVSCYSPENEPEECPWCHDKLGNFVHSDSFDLGSGSNY